MDRPATSRDVAALAGVSQSTVSYVLTGKGGISDATRSRVLQAAERLNYRVNLAARSMRTQRTGRIAIVMPFGTWHFAEVLEGATMAAHDAGYALEIQTLPSTPAGRQERLREIMATNQFEGVLSFTPVRIPSDAGDRSHTTVLALSEYDEKMHVSGELVDAAPLAEMMEGLTQLGHRRFLHVTGALDFASARARRAAFESTVERLGLVNLGVVEGDWSGESGLSALRSLPADIRPPFAVIAANDLVATGVIRGAMERGWSVPGSISVTGWDDRSASAYQVPSLTTVHVDRAELGRRSVARLLATLKGKSYPTHEDALQHVVWRESTGPALPD